MDVGFTKIRRGWTLEGEVQRHQIADCPVLLTGGLREMEEKDVPAVLELYRRYMRRFDMAFEFHSADEIRHQYLSSPKDAQGSTPDKQYMWAYVVEVRPSLYKFAFTAAYPTPRIQRQGRSPTFFRSILCHQPLLEMQRTRHSKLPTYSTTPRTPD